MSAQQRLWGVLGVLFFLSAMLIGTITSPGDGTSPVLAFMVVVVLASAAHLERRERQRH